MKSSAKNKTAQILIPAAILTSGCTVHNTIYTDNLETRAVVRYIDTPNRCFINNSYWNFYNFDPRMNRVHFRRYHRGNYINFYLNINDLQGHGMYFNYQSQTPFYHNQYQGQIYNNNNNQFFQQNNNNQRKISPRIRNNTGRNQRR